MFIIEFLGKNRKGKKKKKEKSFMILSSRGNSYYHLGLFPFRLDLHNSDYVAIII